MILFCSYGYTVNEKWVIITWSGVMNVGLQNQLDFYQLKPKQGAELNLWGGTSWYWPYCSVSWLNQAYHVVLEWYIHRTRWYAYGLISSPSHLFSHLRPPFSSHSFLTLFQPLILLLCQINLGVLILIQIKLGSYGRLAISPI